MIQKVAILIMVTLMLSGCIRRTLTEVPAVSGTVVDSNTANPLADVTINDRFITTENAEFAFPAISKKIWTIPMPGGGAMVSRELKMDKQGYRTTICRVENLSLYAEQNTATLPLLKATESEPSPQPPLFLQLAENLHISCQAFIGSRVRYQGAIYIIGEIYKPEDKNPVLPLLSLWPVFPNKGEVVLDIHPREVELIAGTAE